MPIGSGVWERGGRCGRNVMFPPRAYAVKDVRSTGSIADTAGQERIRELVPQTYEEYDETVNETAS